MNNGMHGGRPYGSPPGRSGSRNRYEPTYGRDDRSRNIPPYSGAYARPDSRSVERPRPDTRGSERPRPDNLSSGRPRPSRQYLREEEEKLNQSPRQDYRNTPDRDPGSRQAAPAFEDVHPDLDDDFDDGFEDDFTSFEPAGSTPPAGRDESPVRPPRSQELTPEDDFEDDFDDDFDLTEVRPAPPAPPARRTENARPSDNADDPWDMAPPRQKASRPPVRQPEPADTRPAVSRPAAPPAVDLYTKLLAAVLALVCVASLFFITSGAYVSRSSVGEGQRSASFDLRQGFDLISSNVVNSVNGLPKVYVLPMSESPASKPLESGYSSYVDDDGDEHLVYHDDTINVDCSRKRYSVEEYTVTAAVARIKISHPTQIRSAFAGGSYSATKREKPSRIASQVNAVTAINGELYNFAGHDNLLIRNGTIYRNNAGQAELLFIDSNGDFQILSYGEAMELGLLDSSSSKIYHTICFGPGLVDDGVLRTNDYLEWTNYGSRNPRSAIGQIGPLEYVLVAVEGRAAHSKGLNLHCLSILMKDLGCVDAYNLDGGQSSILVFNNKVYNAVSNGSERSFADIIYFGSALPEQ